MPKGYLTVYFNGVKLDRDVDHDAEMCAECRMPRFKAGTRRARPFFCYDKTDRAFCNLDCWAAHLASTYQALPLPMRSLLVSVANNVRWPKSEAQVAQIVSNVEAVIFTMLDDEGLLKPMLTVVQNEPSLALAV